MTIGEKIKHYRKIKGLTQKQLGESLGLSAQAVAQWETGNRKPKNETLEKITDALGISLFDLLGISPKEIEKYVALHQLFKSHGYELISDYDAGDGKEWTLCVDNTKKELYLLSENTVEALERSIQDYAIFSINQVLKDAKKVKDTEGWFAKSPDAD